MFVYYDECILSLMSALFTYCKLPTSYKVDQTLDLYLKDHQPKEIQLVIINDLSVDLLFKMLPSDAFLKKHLFKKVTSIFPPLEVPTKTAILAQKSVSDSSYLTDGKSEDVLSHQTNVDVQIIDDLKKCYKLSDVDDEKLSNCLAELDIRVAKMAKELSNDTLLVVVGDCGKTKINRHFNLDTSVLQQHFTKEASLSSRTTMFYIKEEDKENFAKTFKNLLEDDFILFTKEEAIVTKLFGPNCEKVEFIENIGDFVAVAKSDCAFTSEVFAKENYASGGILENELYIPFIIYM